MSISLGFANIRLRISKSPEPCYQTTLSEQVLHRIHEECSNPVSWNSLARAFSGLLCDVGRCAAAAIAFFCVGLPERRLTCSAFINFQNALGTRAYQGSRVLPHFYTLLLTSAVQPFLS